MTAPTGPAPVPPPPLDAPRPPGTGGRIDRHTVTEQLLYEVHDPAAYLTPDVVADLTQADFHCRPSSRRQSGKGGEQPVNLVK